MEVYQTKAGDTWDSIAFEVYGRENLANELIQANQAYITTAIFSGNVTLIVPEIEKAAMMDNLPPWKVSK